LANNLKNTWQNIQKTALLGTERLSISPDIVAQLDKLGLPHNDHEGKILLDLLASFQLIQKAGYVFEDSKMTQQTTNLGIEDDRQICSETAARHFKLVLSGVYPDLLPEFMALLIQHKKSLPPELLPALLDRGVESADFFKKMKPLLGKRGLWLSQQNPYWQNLYTDATQDWQTAAFAQRVLLLVEMRANNPQKATEWLESTWKEEAQNHKIQFLRLFYTGLSLDDEPLLMMAFTDKNREIRMIALQLLCKIPSKMQQDLGNFFIEVGLPFFNSDFQKSVLETVLPDLTYSFAPALVSLLPPKSIGEDWRLGILGLLVQLLPTVFVEKATEKSIAQLLDITNAPTLLDTLYLNILLGVAFHKDENCSKNALLQLGSSSQNPLWKSPLTLDILKDLSEKNAQTTISYLIINHLHLKSTDQSVLKYLQSTDYWSAQLLIDFLDAIKSLFVKHQYWELPTKEYEAIIHAAACKMPLEEIADLERHLPTLRDNYAPFKKELERFTDIMKVRREFLFSFTS
jgi:hypothetical protein